MRKVNGHYYARFYDRDRDPQRKTYPLKASRQDVARRRLTELEEGYRNGKFDPWEGGWQWENATLEEATERFLKAKEQDGLQPSTLDAYQWKLQGLQEHAPPGAHVRDVTPEHIRSYVNAPKKRGDNEPVSNATKRSRYRHIAAFFSWAVEQDLVDESPADDVQKPRVEEKKSAFLSPEDVKKILRTIDAHREVQQGEPGPTAHDKWLKHMIRVAVGTGLRRGELLNLRWKDVDFESGSLIVRHRGDFTAKNGRERVVSLVGDALDTLRSIADSRQPAAGDPVFIDADGDPPKPSRVTKRFKFYVRKAKLEDREELSFHSCRHTTGSWLTMQGVPLRVISEILGHSSTSVTEKYSHLKPGVMDEAMEDTFGGD
jgi:integrase